MVIFIFGFLIGIFIITLLPQLPSITLLAVVVAVAILLISCWRYRSVRAVIGLLLGFFWVSLVARQQQMVNLSPLLNHDSGTIQGIVVALPKRYPHYSQFLLRSERGRQLIKLRWYGYHHILTGDRWQLKVKLHPPVNRNNPGSFNNRKYLFIHQIVAEGMVINSGGDHLISRDHRWGIDRLRQQLAGKMTRSLRGHPLVEMLPALTVGDRHQFSQQQWQVLKETGTAHLMAISGLHIGLVAGLVFMIMKRVWAGMPRLPLYLPASVAAAWIAVLAAISYSAIAGFSLPTDRALVMLLWLFMSVIARRRLAVWQSLLMALFSAWSKSHEIIAHRKISQEIF